MTKKIIALAGDGIGPEVMAEAVRILSWFGRNAGARFEVAEGGIGGCSIDKYGVPLSDAVLQKCREADAVLLGAVGGPKWDKVDYAIRPEAGLLKLRKELGLFANLRPAKVY